MDRGLVAKYSQEKYTVYLALGFCALFCIVLGLAVGFKCGLDRGWDMSVRQVKNDLREGLEDGRPFSVNLGDDRLWLVPSKKYGHYIAELEQK